MCAIMVLLIVVVLVVISNKEEDSNDMSEFGCAQLMELGCLAFSLIILIIAFLIGSLVTDIWILMVRH